MFFSIYTKITTIWLSITIITTVIFGSTNGLVFSIFVLATFYGLFGFIFYHRYLFNLGAIFSDYPKFNI